MDNGYYLYIEMLSYKLTEKRLANLKEPLSFLKKKYFQKL